jgi:hypothetical protein
MHPVLVATTQPDVTHRSVVQIVNLKARIQPLLPSHKPRPDVLRGDRAHRCLLQSTHDPYATPHLPFCCDAQHENELRKVKTDRRGCRQLLRPDNVMTASNHRAIGPAEARGQDRHDYSRQNAKILCTVGDLSEFGACLVRNGNLRSLRHFLLACRIKPPTP